MDILRGPFTAANWRRCAYLVAAVPAGVWGAFLAMRGRSDNAVSVCTQAQRKAARKNPVLLPRLGRAGPAAQRSMASPQSR